MNDNFVDRIISNETLQNFVKFLIPETAENEATDEVWSWI